MMFQQQQMMQMQQGMGGAMAVGMPGFPPMAPAQPPTPTAATPTAVAQPIEPIKSPDDANIKKGEDEAGADIVGGGDAGEATAAAEVVPTVEPPKDLDDSAAV